MPFSFHLPLRADGRAFSFLNNSLEAWGLALAVTVLAGAAMLFLRHYVLRHVVANARKAETHIDDFLATMLSRTYSLKILNIGYKTRLTDSSYMAASACPIPCPMPHA